MIVVTVARRPPAGSVAQNALDHGTGAINVDATRVSAASDDAFGGGSRRSASSGVTMGEFPESYEKGSGWVAGSQKGRWPANLVLSHLPGCRVVGTTKVKSGVSGTGGGFRSSYVSGDTKDNEQSRKVWGTFNGPDGLEAVDAWACAPGCPVADMDAQSGDRKAGGRVSGKEPSDAMGGHTYGKMGRVSGGEPYSDSGGASRFFKQVKP